jgi:hypothetical protein
MKAAVLRKIRTPLKIERVALPEPGVGRDSDPRGRLRGLPARFGSRVFHEGPAARETISIKGGSLDQMLDLGKAIHIWTRANPRGLPIPKHAAQFPQEPDGDD